MAVLGQATQVYNFRLMAEEQDFTKGFAAARESVAQLGEAVETLTGGTAELLERNNKLIITTKRTNQAEEARKKSLEQLNMLGIRSTAQIEKEIRKLEVLIALHSQDAQAVQRLNNIKQEYVGQLERAANGQLKLANQSKYGTFALQNFGFIMQDSSQFALGFDQGIRAIANNMDLFFNTLLLSRKEMGSWGAVGKNMLGTLMGPAGIITAINLATTAFILLGDSIGGSKDEMDAFNSALDEWLKTDVATPNLPLDLESAQEELEFYRGELARTQAQLDRMSSLSMGIMMTMTEERKKSVKELKAEQEAIVGKIKELETEIIKKERIAELDLERAIRDDFEEKEEAAQAALNETLQEAIDYMAERNDLRDANDLMAQRAISRMEEEIEKAKELAEAYAAMQEALAKARQREVTERGEKDRLVVEDFVDPQEGIDEAVREADLLAQGWDAVAASIRETGEDAGLAFEQITLAGGELADLFEFFAQEQPLETFADRTSEAMMMVSNSIGAVGGQLMSLAKTGEETSMAMFAAGKAAAMGSVVVSTGAAVMKTFEHYGYTPWGIAAAVAVGAQGALTLANIASAKPGSTSTTTVLGGGVSSGPNAFTGITNIGSVPAGATIVPLGGGGTSVNVNLRAAGRELVAVVDNERMAQQRIGVTA